MARRKGTKKSHYQDRTPVRKARRVFNKRPQHYPDRMSTPSITHSIFPNDLLQADHIFDRRLFSPVSPVIRTFQQAAPIKRLVTNRLTESFHAVHPKHVNLCVRRKTRREVIFASGFGGSRRSRKVRRNPTSSIHC